MTIKNFIKIIILPLLIIFSYFIVFLDGENIATLGKETPYGVIENLGAIFFLCASIGFFICFEKSINRKTFEKSINERVKYFYLLLGILFFICLGEEISWGQSLFNWDTPDLLKEINAQEETNLHNLWIFHGKHPGCRPKTFIESLLNMNRLFSIFWLIFCVIVPIINRVSKRFRSLFFKIGLPVAPFFIGALFLVNYASFRFFVTNLIEETNNIVHIIEELKETNYAFIFALFSLNELNKYRNTTNIFQKR